MRVLVACEFSGVVRRAFRARGHDAWSCDILPSEDESPFHFVDDALAVVSRGWDLMIAHPPCTYLCNSGVRWLYGGGGATPDPDRWQKMEAAAHFYNALLAAPVDRIAVENPVMHGHAKRLTGGHDQIVQPWMFGHGETKATGLRLKNLPRLVATKIVPGRENRVHRETPSPDRWARRSRTLEGIGEAFAEQWGAL